MNEEIVHPLNSRRRSLHSSASERRAFRLRLVSWFEKNGRDLPWRRNRDGYAVLVSEMMLQQTQVATVIEFFTRWMRRFPDFAALAAASEADVLRAWEGLGYYARARNLHRAAQIIVSKFDGKMPRARAAIRALPGIGRYTAGAISTFAFDESTPIVDANIARVLARIYNLCKPVDTASGDAALWKFASELQPKKSAGAFNEALMELGALVCTPRAPRCVACPVNAFCASPNPEFLPIKKARRKTVALTEHCGFVTRSGKILLEQECGARWRGLWKLPAINAGEFSGKIRPLFQLTYPFTHHRITLKVFTHAAPKPIGKMMRWFSPTEKMAMPAPHRRALNQLLFAKT